MGDCHTIMTDVKEQEDLIAAAEQFKRALGSTKTLTDDMKRLLAELGSHISTVAISNDDNVEMSAVEVSEIEEQFVTIRKKIMSWEADESLIWDSSPEAGFDYLNTVDEARKLIERLESSSYLTKDGDENEMLRKTQDLLQMGMARLEEEFQQMLVSNKQPFEPEQVSFRSSEEDVVDLNSIVSFGDDSFEESLHRDSVSRTSEEVIIDLINPDVISDLRLIANLMFMANYDHECSQAYVMARKDALDECLFILGMEKMSIEEVLKLEWDSLNSKIKRWVRVMKIFIHVYLASEKWLCYQIFGEFGQVSLTCFVEASKASMLQMLNFGEAISIGPHQPEKLMSLLEMYEVLADLLAEVDSLYTDEIGYSVRIEYHEVLRRLGEAVKVAFSEFENAIASYTSTNPLPGGGTHHITRYVMNYLRNLTDYTDTLNLLLKDDNDEDLGLVSRMGSFTEEENSVYENTSPMAHRFISLASILESKLHEKSKLYKDVSLQHFFLMNNIYYMAQKVKNSELRVIFGDKWIREHNGKFQHHEMNYERATWSSILTLLKEDGNSSSNSVSKTQVKETFRNFYLAFEEVYKTQTAWYVRDVQLREDLRISTSLKVVQAFRTFEKRHVNHISDRHIKYSAEDLENYLLDFFEGSPKSLHNPHRR